MHLKEIITSLMEDTKLYLHQMDTVTYTSPIPALSNATIGQHTRHFIEFFQCLLQQYPEGVINYDKRERNKQIETDTFFTVQAIDLILMLLPEAIPENNNIILESDYGVECEQCVNAPTNLARELIYNIEHTIHHLAIIKIGLGIIAPQIALSKHFGVAPSTVKHQNVAA